MKKIIFYALTLAVFTSGQLVAQTASQNLDNAVQSAGNIQTGVTTAKKAVNQLAKQLVILGNPDVQLFNDKMYAQVGTVQNNADDVDYFTSEAQSVTSIPFSSAGITALTAGLVTLNDELMVLTSQVTDAINSNDTNTAVNLIPQLNAVLDNQNTAAADLISTLQSISQSVKTYTVTIRLVDYLGNPVATNDLHGFYAGNDADNSYIEPDNQDSDTFSNLVNGTYTFRARNGYFSGASPTTVTLSEQPVNSTGVIIVNLVYWAE